MTMECLRNGKRKCDWSIINEGKSIYGIEVREEILARSKFTEKVKCSVLLYNILDTCKFCRNIKKVAGYKTLKLRIMSKGVDLGVIGTEKYLKAYV